MEEMKRMRKDIARFDEMMQSKDNKIKRRELSIDKTRESELRFKSDLHEMAGVIKSQAMVIEKLQAVNEKQVETIRGIQFQLTNVIQLSCSYANMTRSSCQSSITSRTPNTAPNPSVIESCRLDSRHGVLSDQNEYRNAGLSDSRQPAYGSRNVGLMQSPLAQILSTTAPTVNCEADKGETYEKKIVESENETNRNRLSDKRNSPPQKS
ncbi:hypothetical protein CHS0354_017337 [Potamilus streckersoni]|uniref:Uncharacterized protein n=1 Tax=Potamilus streckersoni TaxID=2493646 RepID=A0AAE0T597_9BIVA|nr:hypothetical protein CHS0354_017337 [Potamilus streckersoni]